MTGPGVRHPIHWPLVLATLAATGFGVIVVFSAGQGPTGDLGFGARQAVFAATGLMLMTTSSRIDYRRLWRFNRPMTLVTVLALVAVLTPLGTEVRGTQGWFRIGPISAQPSEFAKLTLVVGLALILSGRNTDHRSGAPGRETHRRTGRPGPTQFALSVGLLGLLAGLVLAQGETGTIMVLCAVTLGVLVSSGLPARYLVLLVVTGVATVGLTLSMDVLAPYQVDRFEAFLDPDLDPLGVGYNQQQALTAIGSGGVAGAGLFGGPQTQLGYLPDQHTDFIFAAVAEELGFVGAVAAMVLQATVLGLVLLIANDTRDRFGRLVCVGVFSLLAFQVIQNVGMNLRLMPITGISLPFMSYGGSALLTTMLAIGLVLSVWAHRAPDDPVLRRRLGD